VTATRSFASTMPAPEFPSGLDWLNTGRPLSLAELRGKVVLLDFWTYGCINCMHIIPDLKRLEEKYADELVVIGVHSAKFANEGDSDNIRRIIQRYELEHPVVNDKDFFVWRQYGARAWPTLVLIDPDGNLIGSHSGEGIYDLFDHVIGSVAAEFDALGRIDRTPLELVLEREGLANSPLLFPGKVLADTKHNRLFIADSNHNRVVVTDLEGRVIAAMGSGEAGFDDGDFETATFFRPQGLALADEHTLYVADTENHAIRRVDLAAQQVETVAGTGEQNHDLRNTGGPALSTSLNSPWDVLFHDGVAYIAMAGQHQLWAYHPDTGAVRLHAGSGREELRDGPLNRGGLNQPSGLATDGEVLYFADSEASAVRTASLNPKGRLETIVGTGLFDFGDLDGVGDAVRLQHPLGVAYKDGLLYVADTYNSKIKTVDPATRESRTLLGSEEAGWRDGVGQDALFDEPGGLSVAGEVLYVADTNNHVVRVAHLSTRQVITLVLADPDGLLVRQPPDAAFAGRIITLERQTVAPGEVTLRLAARLPEGYKINDLAPFSVSWSSEDVKISLRPDDTRRSIVKPTFPVELPISATAGDATLVGEVVLYYCEAEKESLCLMDQVRLVVPVTVAAEGQDSLEVSYAVPSPPDVSGNQW
jgi:thiol-disulfide isomerase/thioredoxin